jgi:hypothetical protein
VISEWTLFTLFIEQLQGGPADVGHTETSHVQSRLTYSLHICFYGLDVIQKSFESMVDYEEAVEEAGRRSNCKHV